MGIVDLVPGALMVTPPPAPWGTPQPPPWYTEWATASTVLIYAALMFIALVLLVFFGAMLYLILKMNKKIEPMLGKVPPLAKKVEAVTVTGSDRIMRLVIEFHAWDTAIRTGLRTLVRPPAGQVVSEQVAPAPVRQMLPSHISRGSDGRFAGERESALGGGHEREQHPVG